MRKWTPSTSDNSGWDTIYQMVVPKCFREQVMSVAHDNVAGHLGVTKTLYRVMRHFFWPKIKSAVTKYCRSCHTCQMVGKPNQAVPPAPLKPIPAIGEPFERVIIDCVGPLPKTKSGYTYLLTIMCAATRYPEAIPLRSLRAKAIVKALTFSFLLLDFQRSSKRTRELILCPVCLIRFYLSYISSTLFRVPIILSRRVLWRDSTKR